jgi:hypothetical protein
VKTEETSVCNSECGNCDSAIINYSYELSVQGVNESNHRIQSPSINDGPLSRENIYTYYLLVWVHVSQSNNDGIYFYKYLKIITSIETHSNKYNKNKY